MKTKRACPFVLVIAAAIGGCTSLPEGRTFATTGDFPGIVIWEDIGKPRHLEVARDSSEKPRDDAVATR